MAEPVASAGRLGRSMFIGTHQESGLKCLFGFRLMDLEENTQFLTVPTTHGNGQTCGRGTQTAGLQKMP